MDAAFAPLLFHRGQFWNLLTFHSGSDRNICTAFQRVLGQLWRDPTQALKGSIFNGTLEVTLTTGLGQQSTKMTRCWDKMCFLQVWLVCSGSMSPHTAETLPNTLLCLKGSCDSEENHPAPQHFGESFPDPWALHVHHPLLSALLPLQRATRQHLGAFGVLLKGHLAQGCSWRPGVPKFLLNYCWIWGGKEVWSSLIQPAQSRINLKFAHLVARGQNQLNFECLQGSPSTCCSVWSLPWRCQKPLMQHLLRI